MDFFFLVAFGSKWFLKLIFKILNDNSKFNFKRSDLYSFYGVLEKRSFHGRLRLEMEFKIKT